MKMIRQILCRILVATLAMACGLAVGPGSASADATGVNVITQGDESTLSAILRIAKRDPAFGKAVQSLAKSWKSQVDHGRTLPSINDRELSTREVRALEALANGDLSAAAAVVPTSPNTFPVRGKAAGDQSYWIEMTAVVAVKYCDAHGCTQTDKMNHKDEG